jgi:acyl-CoA thioester hydrolase
MRRRNENAYFAVDPGSPPPLTVATKRRVRFEDVDPLSIVWHGRYPSYFEDGRAAFGDKYSLSYLDMYKQGFFAPIVQLHIDYHSPLRFPEEFTVVAALHWTDAVKLNFSYKIIGAGKETVATGYTVQLLTSLDTEIMLVRPEYIENFVLKWKEQA